MSTDKAALFLYYWRLDSSYRPQPEPEYQFAPPRKFRFDWAWPAQKVAVEVDGGVWLAHGGRHGTDQDREKRNLAASLGWRLLFFSPQMLNTDPDTCISLVLQSLHTAKEAA